MKEKTNNIILIFTDQHRLDTLRCYKPDTICQTPNLDRLAENSVVFDHAYTTCPVCSPARSSLHTGLYPSKTGMETNIYQTGCRIHELEDRPELLSRRLEDCGYALGYTGKWHLGERRLPTDIGFIGDDFPGHGNGGWEYPQFQRYLAERGLQLDMINRGVRRRPGDHSMWAEVVSPVESTIEYYITQRAIDIMEGFSKENRPFFFSLNYWGPHEPYYAPASFLDIYRNTEIPECPSYREEPDNMPGIYNLLRREDADWGFFQNTLRHYYACISHLDAQIGRLLDYLRNKGLYEDTMIIFSADHGDNQGCHGGLENKSYGMYEDTTHIPLLIKPPGSSVQSRHQKAFASTCDIYATILDQAGYIPGDPYGFGDGRSLKRFLDSDNMAGWPDDIVTEGMGAFDIIVTQRMYRQGTYKYVFNGGGKDQFFDMKEDPYEMKNLIEDSACQNIILQVKNDFADWMICHNDPVRSGFCKLNHIKEWASI